MLVQVQPYEAQLFLFAPLPMWRPLFPIFSTSFSFSSFYHEKSRHPHFCECLLSFYRCRSKKDLLFFYSGCTASRRMPNTRRSKNPTNPFPRTTTTFMPKHSFQRWANVKPMATMMIAARNSVSPYGQKQERVSPRPNAVAQLPHRRHTGRGTQCCFMVFAPFPSHCIPKGRKRFRIVYFTGTLTGL